MMTVKPVAADGAQKPSVSGRTWRTRTEAQSETSVWGRGSVRSWVGVRMVWNTSAPF